MSTKDIVRALLDRLPDDCSLEDVPQVRDGVSRGVVVGFELLETVVLDRDISELGLRKGDLGAIVHIHETGELEVEFVSAAGRTEALVALVPSDIRRVADFDLVSVRPFRRTA